MFLKISINFFLFLLIFTSNLKAKENWVLDKDLSSIEFELPVLLLKNVKGKFTNIEGLVEIDVDTKKNNKAIFSVSTKSIDMNYKKYKNLLLGKTFFNTKKYPIALIDTNKFSYNDEKTLELNVHLTIKGRTNTVPLQLKIKHLAEELVQLQGYLTFSRTAFLIGEDEWSSTSILKDNASIYANLFLFKK